MISLAKRRQISGHINPVVSVANNLAGDGRGLPEWVSGRTLHVLLPGTLEVA